MENIIAKLQQINPSIGAITVYDWQKNQILYQSAEWDITQDLGPILSVWMESQPSVLVQGIKYSTLQCTPERFVAQNLQGQGAILGANYQNRLIVIAWVAPDGDPGHAYRDITRSMDEMLQMGY